MAKVTRREAMKAALKGGAYAAPVVLAAVTPEALSAQTLVSPPPIRPVIRGVNPLAGPIAGGTRVSLSGTDFCTNPTVTVNGAAATDVRVFNPTTIDFLTPAGTVGIGTIAVTCAGGTGTGPFIYFTGMGPPLTITRVSPSSGPSAGGTAVTLTGTNFCTNATVMVSGVAATDVTVVSTTTITFTTPAGVGLGTIAVICPNSVGTALFQYGP